MYLRVIASALHAFKMLTGGRERGWTIFPMLVFAAMVLSVFFFESCCIVTWVYFKLRTISSANILKLELNIANSDIKVAKSSWKGQHSKIFSSNVSQRMAMLAVTYCKQCCQKQATIHGVSQEKTNQYYHETCKKV
jgi:hypothetical protein